MIIVLAKDLFHMVLLHGTVSQKKTKLTLDNLEKT